jgi:opacity protein-like surface antigen
MKKKIALIVVCLFLMSSAAFAAPLTNYSPGKASVDFNFRNAKNSLGNTSFESKYGFEPSVTVGVLPGLAIQYRGASAKSGGDPNLKLDVTEFNALYSLTPQVSIFGGHVKTKGTLSGGPSGDRNIMQIGLLSSISVVKNVSIYGIVGTGHKWVNSEIGIAYSFAKNWELNVDYRHINSKDLIGKNNVIAKGYGFGATYKFR